MYEDHFKNKIGFSISMKNIISFILDFRDNMSGIELASSMRSLMLQDILGLDHTYFTSIYNRMLSHNVNIYKNVGRLSRNAKYINIYDFYQDASDQFDVEEYNIEDKFRNYKVSKIDGKKDYRVYNSNGKFKFFIKIFDFKNSIDFINYLDDNGKVVRTDYYDVRNFLSMSHLYFNDISEKAWLQIYYRPNSSIAIVKQMQQIENKTVLNIKLFDDSGLIISEFDNEDDFLYNFIKLIISEGRFDEFIIDRCKEFYGHVTRSLSENFIQKSPIVILHSAHSGANPADGITSHFYDIALSDVSKKILVTLTNKQKIDVDKRYSNTDTFYIPNFYDAKKSININKENVIVYVARYTEEKQHNIALDIFKIVSEKNTDVIFEMYGFGELKDKIITYAKELNLSDRVKVLDFAFDISQIYNKAKLSILTSRTEGFCMGLIESLSYGCPVVSFDINYGPSEIIIDGQNGFLVSGFDKEMFADKILKIINDDMMQSKLSENSIKLSQKYNSKSVSDLWRNLLIEK